MAERHTVDVDVVGSTPIAHPNFMEKTVPDTMSGTVFVLGSDHSTAMIGEISGK